MSRHSIKQVLFRPVMGAEPDRRALPDKADGRPGTEVIALRAYELWRQRGSPIGSPEVDWLAAERELKQRAARPFVG